jgi:Ras-related protein Rab-3C
MRYFESSAKDNINIKQTFDALVDEISEKMAESIEKNPNFNRRGTRLRDSGSEASSSGGCSC